MRVSCGGAEVGINLDYLAKFIISSQRLRRVVV
jgi:hypothetical protein